MAILIAIGGAISTGNILFGVLSGLAWQCCAHSRFGILYALAVIGGLGALFGVAT